MKKRKYSYILMLALIVILGFLYTKERNKGAENNYKEVEESSIKETIAKENIISEQHKKKQTTIPKVKQIKQTTQKKKIQKKEELSKYNDYTKEIMKSMEEEIKDAKKYCDEMIALGENQYSVTALAWYFKTFQNNGYMDIKHKKQWENKFKNIPYPGESGIFVFQGEKTTPEELGNILYGMIGRKMGFSPKLIYQGSGFAAGATGEILNDASSYYGDSKEDYLSIKRGISYVKNKEMIEFDLSKIPTKILKLLKKFT